MQKNDKSTLFHPKRPVCFNGKTLSFESCRIMGILNVTPDSFYDGGSYDNPKNALEQAEKMIGEGADILDIGAVSTRPGASTVPADEESQRLLPVLKEARKMFPEIFISVDTCNASVARIAMGEGADIINDISGGNFDPDMIPFIIDSGMPYIVMHIQGTPANMQEKPYYRDVVAEVKDFLLKQASKVTNGGNANVIIDPGFGFGKTVGHNFELLRNLEAFHQKGYPLLAGFSRKSMINRVLRTNPGSALNGTTVLNTIALMKRADILRVHDVKECMEAVKLVEYYMP
jgi:dihydropteroate synthase